jgi:hypothetical protein
LVERKKAFHAARRRMAKPLSQVQFLADDTTAGPHQITQRSQCLQRPFQMHQHQTAISHVEGFGRQSRSVGIALLKGDVCQLLLCGLSPGLLDLRLILVETNNRAARADLASNPARHIAGAATDLRHAQSFSQTSLAQDGVRSGSVNLIEEAQPLDILRAGRQDVDRAGVFHGSSPDEWKTAEFVSGGYLNLNESRDQSNPSMKKTRPAKLTGR